MSREYKIYGLVDPLTLELRYVGQCIVPIEQRFKAHLHENLNNRKNQWIRSLKNKGTKPEIFVIDTCNDFDECMRMEMFWIAYFKSIGSRLTNVTTGGEGVSGRKASAEERETRRKARLGWKHSPETIKKLSEKARQRDPSCYKRMAEKRKGQKPSNLAIQRSRERILNRTPEQKKVFAELIRQSNKTRIISDETREKYRHRHQSRVKPGWVRKKISQTLKGKKHSEERIQKRINTINRKKLEAIKAISI